MKSFFLIEVIETEKQSIFIIRIKVKNSRENGCTKNGNAEIEKGLETIKVNAKRTTRLVEIECKRYRGQERANGHLYPQILEL